MLRHGIPEDVVMALRSRLARASAPGARGPRSPGRFTTARSSSSATARSRSSTARATAPPTPLFWDAERRILLCADHLIAHISSNPLISRPLDGSTERPRALMTYLESLRRPASCRPRSCSRATASRSPTIAALIDERFALHRRRAEKIFGLIAERPRTAYEIAQELWGNVAVTQAFLTLSEVVGHVDLLIDEGRVREEAPTATWSASRRPESTADG